MKLDSNRYEKYFDMFNHYNLIIKVNSGYKLFFDKKEKCFVVINTAKNNQICLKTYNISDNLSKILQITRVENSKEIFENIDKFNKNLIDKNQNNLNDEIKQKTVDLVNFSKRVSNISNKDLNKIIEEKYV